MTMYSMMLCDAYFQTSGSVIKEVNTYILLFFPFFGWSYESYFRDNRLFDFLDIL